LSRLDRALREGQVTNNGPYVREFEAVLSKYLRQPAIVFSSGYSALVTMLMALDVAGREVILPSFTFPATPDAVLQAGGIPIYADIKSDTLTLDSKDVERRITENTIAIVPVDSYGIAASDIELHTLACKYDIKVLSDSAPSFGTNILTKPSCHHAYASIYSFHATKQLAVGEGGCLTSCNERFITRCKEIRNFGLSGEDWIRPGINGKMTEISALIGLENMKDFQERVLTRRSINQKIRYSLRDIKGITCIGEPEGQLVSWCYCPILLDHDVEITRDALSTLLLQRGIQTRRYYQPCHPSDEFGDLPVTEDVYLRVLALPCYESMTEDELRRIRIAFEDIMGER